MKKRILPTIIAATSLVLASQASVVTVASYNFTSNLSATSSAVTGISSVTAITFGSGSASTTATNQGYTTARYNGTIAGDTVSGRSTSGSGGTNGSVYVRAAGADGDTLATAISGGRSITAPTNSDVFSSTANDYFGFSFTVDTGYTLSLSSFTFDAARASSSGGSPNQVQLLLSPTGFTSSDSLGGATIATIGDAVTYQSISITTLGSVSALQNLVAGTYEARLYVFGGIVGTSSDNPTRFDNLVLSGDLSLATIPEPSTYAVLAGVCGLGFATLLRRRK